MFIYGLSLFNFQLCLPGDIQNSMYWNRNWQSFMVRIVSLLHWFCFHIIFILSDRAFFLKMWPYTNFLVVSMSVFKNKTIICHANKHGQLWCCLGPCGRRGCSIPTYHKRSLKGGWCISVMYSLLNGQDVLLDSWAWFSVWASLKKFDIWWLSQTNSARVLSMRELPSSSQMCQTKRHSYSRLL